MSAWFTENDKSCRYGYEISGMLASGQSEFQSYKVLETIEFGKMLVLDDIIMLTERDEFIYHEMIAHVPTLFHGAPKRALVIGGGDGGTVRELLKHSSYEEITLCEIDVKVVELGQKFFPEVSCGLTDPKVTVLCQDGIKFVQNHEENYFDIVIIDSSDPVGPGVGLFTKDFYQNCRNILKEDGCLVAQTESPWFPENVVVNIQRSISEAFPHVSPYLGVVPTYPKGLWSWTLASSREIKPTKIDGSFLNEARSSLSYLNPEVLVGSFALPNFYRNKLSKQL